MPWLRLRTKVSAKDAESIGERLQAAGAVAVSLLPDDEQDDAAVEPAPGRTPLWNTLRLDGLFPLDADLTTLPRLDYAVDFVADRNWSETWRDGLAPLRFGRLLVVSASSQAASASDDVLVRLDPGLAFGTGTHPTTALCLAWLACRPLAKRRVLDVGSGSGILAIAASRLGAAAVAAVDRDPQARRASADNARANRIPLTLRDSLAEVEGDFDMVLANIVADTLCELAPDLTERVEPAAGLLALSGILPAQAERVMCAFPRFHFQAPAVRDGWVLLWGRRNDG